MPDILSALQRRPKSLVVAFTLTVLTAVATHQVTNLRWRHTVTLRDAQTRARNLAFVVGEHVRASFTIADTSLRQLIVHGQRVGGAEAPPEAWRPILAAARNALPGGSLTVVDAAGRIRHSTQPVIVGDSRRDHYVFRKLAEPAADDLVVDRPFLTPVPPRRYVIPLGRRLTRPDGAFDGVVVATLIPESYRAFLRTVDVGREGFAWVLHPDGVVIFREPSDEDPIGEQVPHNWLAEAALTGGSRGILQGPLEPGGPDYISAYERLNAPPLLVAVSLDRAEVLAHWADQRQAAALAFAVLALALGGMVLVLFRQIDARAEVERALLEVQRLEAGRLRDANDRMAAALEREQAARREAEEANYAKDEFLMTLSHELRTPLTAIYGWVRMLGTDAIRQGERPRALAAIERNARAQVRLIDDLLDVSRAISGKLRIDSHPTRVTEVARAAVETLRPAMEAKFIRFVSALDTDAGTILADPDRLQQIIWNLLANAIKFTPTGGTVELRVERLHANVEIVVRDTGAGIAPEFLPHVFDRFRQAEAGTRRRYGGLGLGLAIVRHLVELHGGTVSAESTGEGRGATFRVLLPLRFEQYERMEERRSPPPAEPPRPVLARLEQTRVLVVDDEPDARELFTSILHAAGAEVRSAGSAAEAHRALAAELPDAIVSDIEMPGEDGYAFLRRALANPRVAERRPVAIAVTAHARSTDRRLARDAGYDWHLAKPVEPAELVDVLSSLITARRDQATG